MGDPWRPPAPLLRAFPFVGAAMVGALVFIAARPGHTDSVPLGTLEGEQTAAVERGWVDAGLPRKYLPAPLAPAPCTTSGRTWTTPLVEAYGYVQEGQPGLARRVIDLYLSTPAAQAAQSSMAIPIVLADSSSTSPRPEAGDVLEMIYLLQLYGYLNLSGGYASDSLVHRLKRPIGFTSRLTYRGHVGRIPGQETTSRMSIRAPGCGVDGLTTYHLYNNLLVAYLSTPRYHQPNRAKEREEFDRDYPVEISENPLLPLVKDSTHRRMGWEWAVSNAERLLHSVEDSLHSLQAAPWLAINLAEVLDSASLEAPPNMARAMLDKRDTLAQLAWRSSSASPEQAREMTRSLTRLLLLRGIRRGDAPDLSALRPRLDPKEDSTVRAVVRALQWRRDADSLQARLERGGGADSLGVANPDAWFAAARWDLAAHFARIGKGRPASEQAGWEGRAGAVLQPNDPEPQALIELKSNRSLARLAQRWPLPAGLATAAMAFVPLWCLAWVLRRRKAIWVSYYRMEARERLTNAP